MKNPNPAPIEIQVRCDEAKRLIARTTFLADASGEISDEQTASKALNDHIATLAQTYCIRLCVHAGALSKIPCRYFSNLQSVHIPFAVGPLTYICALHELGHAVLNESMRQTDMEELDEEFKAWEWAFEVSMIPITTQIVDYKESALDQYRHLRVCDDCKKTMEIRRDDDPAVYDLLAKEMFGIVR